MAKVKACKNCGEPFVAEDDELVFCCFDCYLKYKKKPRRQETEVSKLKREKKAEKEARCTLSESRRARLARRDAEYAANAAPVKSVEHDGVRIETRGNRFCGSLSGVHRQLVTDYGVVYVA